MSKCGDCKFWDRENIEILSDGRSVISNIAKCNDGDYYMRENDDFFCCDFKPIKLKPAREDLHRMLDDLLDARD